MRPASWWASCGSPASRRGTSGRRRRRAGARPRAGRDRRNTSATGRATPPAARRPAAPDRAAPYRRPDDGGETQQRLGRQPERLDHDVEGAELAAMAPDHALDIERRGIEPVGDGLDLRRRHEQEHRARIDESADQPGTGDAVDLRPRSGDPDRAPVPVALRHALGRNQRQARLLPANEAVFQGSAGTPPCRSQAAAPSLSFSPFWQTTMADRPANSPAQSETSPCGRRVAPGTSRGSALKSSSVRTSIRTGQCGVPMSRASFSMEMELIDDMMRPCFEAGRDTWACRLVGRSHSPCARKNRAGEELSRQIQGSGGGTLRHS